MLISPLFKEAVEQSYSANYIIHMRFSDTLIRGRFIRRYKRFLTDIELENGDIVLNPPMNTTMNEKDQIIAISEDDDTIILDQPDNLEITEEAIKMTMSRRKILRTS